MRGVDLSGLLSCLTAPKLHGVNLPAGWPKHLRAYQYAVGPRKTHPGESKFVIAFLPAKPPEGIHVDSIEKFVADLLAKLTKTTDPAAIAQLEADAPKIVDGVLATLDIIKTIRASTKPAITATVTVK